MNLLVTRTFKGHGNPRGRGVRYGGHRQQIGVKTTNKIWQGDERETGNTEFGGDVF